MPIISAVDDNTYKISNASVSRAFSTGFKQVFKLTTASGRTIKATANHKFLTIDGWKRLNELSTENHLATPRVLKQHSNRPTMTNSQAALLGHLIGDGCTLPSHSIQYTTNDITLADTVLNLSINIFGDTVKPRIQKERDWYQVYLPSTQRLTHNVSNPITVWLKSMGVFGLRSHEKYIPDQIFEQNNEVISTFIRHLWSTDGCIKTYSKGHPKIYYASSSLKLANTLKSLLLRLGITARLHRYSQGTKGMDQYHVTISGYENLSLFSALVGAVGVDKIRHLSLVNDYLASKSGNTNRDVIPKSVWRSHVVPSMMKIGMTTRQMQSQISSAYSGTSLYKANLSRDRAERVATIVKSAELEALSKSDIYWDQIISIEKLGIEEVFDLTVPGPHNFVANDIIVHNSIEQDADVVAFIYREEYYNPETDRKRLTDLLIKKHRNGPTGGVELYFDSEKQRFKSVDTKHQEPRD
jgi:replicative DNA helicase